MFKNILFTICGRAGSKGVKNKNIRNFVDCPLPYYTLSAIDLFLKRNHETNHDIVVNTDSEELIRLMAHNPLQRDVEIIEREKELAGDDIGKIGVVCNCLDIVEERKRKKYDVIIDLDITSPLRRVIDIERLLKKHYEKKPDLTTSVVAARRNPYFNQVIDSEQGIKRVIETNYTSRQQTPKVYDMNASMYAYSPSHLRSGRNVLDGYCEMIEMFDTAILDIDHENDLELMEIIARYLYEKYDDFGEIRSNIFADA